ncbi:trichohyalin isoform X2 [Labrus mixtus]|uniref:trichohyalin isoform X2 n=1 Tax=Labrus mixtus TaxID=508554 RepID=UPI0029C0FE93|nr:trichohyalin isoform X2 [Labrus mixtus]
MSVSSLPEWKQLLLEKKRREEEERERREKEEEAKFASMPAWKRGIIQRRKAKQDSVGDKEKDRDVCLLQVDARCPSDCLSDTDSFITVNFGSDLSLSPDPGQWLEAELKPASQVSVETIVPVHENPFIRTQSAKRKGRDAEAGTEQEVKERDKDKSSPRSQEVESGRERDIETKKERFRDLSEGREMERSRDRSQGREQEKPREGWEKDKSQWKDSAKDQAREQESLNQVRKEETETDPLNSSSSALVPCLRTIRADNIIIIEQDRKGNEERRGRWREAESERPEEDNQGKRGMKMNLREILSVGGCVTEIRASEVLIIKPSSSPEERNPGGGGGNKSLGREDGEIKGSVDGRRESMCRELRTDMSWLREKEREKEKPWGQATVIKDDTKDSVDDNVFVERGGRVSQLLSKFGEHPKPPSRSKSSDNFLRPGRRKLSEEDNDQQSEERRADGRNTSLKGVPKRSFSFSDRVISAKENGLDDDGYYERNVRERIHSDKSMPPWVEQAGNEIKLGYTRFLDKDRFRKDRDKHCKNKEEQGGPVQRKNDSEVNIKHRSEVKKVEAFDIRAAEKDGDVDGDEGFTVASVKNTEGISFARRLPIRQDGRTRAERETKQVKGQTSSEKELIGEKDSGFERQAEKVSDLGREDGFESFIQTESLQKSNVAASAEQAIPGHVQYRHESAFKDCTNLLCAVADRARDNHAGSEWSGVGPQGSYHSHSVLSKQTEELLSKIERIGETTVYHTEKGERAYKAANEMPKESKQEGQTSSDNDSENPVHHVTPRSPKRIASAGIPPGPLEIQIPRSVFYVAQEMDEKKKGEGQGDEGKDREAGRGVERRDSWRIGKPLSRIESLREKIRQRALEVLRQKEAQDGGEVAERNDTAGDSCDERGNEIEKEGEAATRMRKRSVEAERGQEDTAEQTSMTAFDVTQEVDVLKTNPQLPLSVPHSQAVREEEVTSGYATAAAEGTSDSFQTTEDEDDPVKHVEEQLRRHRSQQEQNKETERAEEGKELAEVKAEDYPSPLDSVQSISSLQPHPNSIPAMSRIYNIETAGSRSALCLKERTVEISPVHLVKVKPLTSNAQQSDSKDSSGEDACGFQTIQQQIEQFQLKEQEALKSCTSTNNPFDVRGTKGQQSSRGGLKHLVKDNVKTQEEDQETSESNAPHRACSPSSRLKPTNQTITVKASLIRSQSPDNTLKPSDCTPTPACSPSSQSPAQSPSVSPSTTPSPTLFSIRSASGGQVKRGATITISSRKTTGATGSTAGSTTAGSTAAKTSSHQAQTTSAVAEPVKKKYPTVEEIEVIGGYQNLDKSCLVKIRGTPKRGKVYFDEDQLEQLCEYPSETSMLASTPLWRTEKPQGEEVQEEEAEVEGGAMVSKSTRNVGISTGRGLIVDESQ